MDIYVSTLAGILRPLEKVVVSAIKLGFRNIEIIDDWDHKLNSKRARNLIDLKSSYSLNFIVHAPFDGLNIATPQTMLRRAALKLIERSMEFAHKLEAKLIVVHSGFKSPLDYFKPRKTWETFVHVLKRLNGLAEDLNLYVGIENMPAGTFALIHTHSDALNALRDAGFPDRVKLTLDVGHSNTINPRETINFLDNAYDFIAHMHIHDNNGKGDDHLAVGSGSINWRPVLDRAKRLKLIGGLTLEVMSLRDALKSLRRIMSLTS